MTDFYKFKAKDIKGKNVSFSLFKDKTLLIVNTASRCGFTPQYKDLEALYQKYRDQDFLVLGFPCNQFAGQEPEDESAIYDFCEINFGVTFPLFSKIDVNGDNTHPLFAWLKKSLPGFLGSEFIKWNFTKFLVSKEGEAVKRYGPKNSFKSLEKDIKKIL